MAPRQTNQRDVPTHLQYPLSASQVEALDAMLVELYRLGGKIHLDQVVGGAGDLSAVNDTNVTLTLTGTPLGALLEDVGLTLGWTGRLAVARGGVGTLPNDATKFFDGTGAFTTPSSLSVAQAAARVSVRI